MSPEQAGQQRDAATAVAEPPKIEDFPGSTEELLAEVERLTEKNRAERDPEREQLLLTLRHAAGVRTEREAPHDARHVAPGEPPPETDGLPDVAPEALTPELLRAGILRDGAVLVRGLIDSEEALAFADKIDRCFEDRARAVEDGERLGIGNGARSGGLYGELELLRGYRKPMRNWVQMGGGVLAFDSPALAFEMLELFAAAGLPQLVSGYLGEPGLLALQKTTLRKADPSVPGAWHQDGYFLGPVRALNLWLSLSHCGDEAPGLDLVPRRFDELVPTGTEGTRLDYEVSPQVAEDVAGDRPIVRPIFEPGDALLFDDLFLHQTGADPSMPKPRFAIESWFFGASGFPGEYAPLAV